MSPGIRPVRMQPADMAEEDAIKSWLDALANGTCDAPAFLQAMQGRYSAEPDENWEVLSQLDQYYRRGRIDTEVFKTIKTALAESAMGLSSSSAAVVSSAVRAAQPPPAATVHVIPPPARDTSAARDIPALRDIPAARVVPAIPEETQATDCIGDLKPGAVLRRRYRIEGVLGQGRMGTLFQVLDEFRLEGPGTQRLAIKVLHPTVAKRADLLAESRREFQALQLLSHPNIIRVFDFDRDGPWVFFTMELLTGTPLSRLLQARKLVPLERPQALAVIRDIGAAIVYAHARGTVHGDLNLQNIFITTSGELRVMGFGGSFKAHQAYQAPEHEMTLPLSASTCASCQVLEGERADIRDDVFSLAYIAYLLLSGAHPFTKSTAIEARASKFRIRRPANLSGRQWQALRSALRWECEKRPTDVERWLKELEIHRAAKRLAPLNDLLQTPSAKKSPWRGAGIAAGVAVLLLAGYWAVSHPELLPSIDSIAGRPAAVAASSAVALPPPAAITVPAAITAPAVIAAPASREAPVALALKTPPPAASVGPSPVTTTATGASKVELAEDTVDVPAGQPSAEVIVHRKGNLRGETSFTWWTESGTAKPGTDFSAVVPQLAYFTSGKSNVSLSVPLRNTRHTQSKSFYVVIDQSPGGAPTGSRTLTLVTLPPSG
jgi:serine/threonine protein kinase